jgi:hypothetical protein
MFQYKVALLIVSLFALILVLLFNCSSNLSITKVEKVVVRYDYGTNTAHKKGPCPPPRESCNINSYSAYYTCDVSHDTYQCSEDGFLWILVRKYEGGLQIPSGATGPLKI